jgi:hypothetical protein
MARAGTGSATTEHGDLNGPHAANVAPELGAEGV